MLPLVVFGLISLIVIISTLRNRSVCLPRRGTEGGEMLILNRFCSDNGGTHGLFIYNRAPVCHSLELPWLGNIVNKSCIPPGTYPLKKIIHPRFAHSFSIENVPGRSGILIHPGNSLADIRGCILPGLDYNSDTLLIQNSRFALNRLLSLLPIVSTLSIREV